MPLPRKTRLESAVPTKAVWRYTNLWCYLHWASFGTCWKNAPEKILGQEVGDLGGGLDSTRSGVIYLSETISKLDFKSPDKLKEKIIASKVSGDDNGFSFNNASDVDYNFYNNTIEIGNQLVSPVSEFAFNYYRYNLEGVFYDDRGNLINKIRVTPKRENDRVFSGLVYIIEWIEFAIQ